MSPGISLGWIEIVVLAGDRPALLGHPSLYRIVYFEGWGPGRCVHALPRFLDAFLRPSCSSSAPGSTPKTSQRASNSSPSKLATRPWFRLRRYMVVRLILPSDAFATA